MPSLFSISVSAQFIIFTFASVKYAPVHLSIDLTGIIRPSVQRVHLVLCSRWQSQSIVQPKVLSSPSPSSGTSSLARRPFDKTTFFPFPFLPLFVPSGARRLARRGKRTHEKSHPHSQTHFWTHFLFVKFSSLILFYSKRNSGLTGANLKLIAVAIVFRRNVNWRNAFCRKPLPFSTVL